MAEEVQVSDGEPSKAPPEVNEDKQRALDHGWKPLEDYDGPEGQWTDYKAFNRYYDKQQESKAYKNEVSELKQSVGQLIENFESMTKRQQDAHKKELDRAIAQAKKDEDFEEYDRLHKEKSTIDAVEETPKPKANDASHHQNIVSEFKEEHPELARGTEGYSLPFDSTFNSVAAQMLAEETGGNQPTDAQLKRILKQALSETQKHFKKPEPATRTPPKTNKAKGGGKGGDVSSRLDDSAMQTYNIIKKTRGEDVANNFAKNYLGEE